MFRYFCTFAEKKNPISQLNSCKYNAHNSINYNSSHCISLNVVRHTTPPSESNYSNSARDKASLLLYSVNYETLKT